MFKFITFATSVGTRVLKMWANQQCTLGVLQNALATGKIDEGEYQAAITANPPIDPNDPNSYSQP